MIRWVGAARDQMGNRGCSCSRRNDDHPIEASIDVPIDFKSPIAVAFDLEGHLIVIEKDSNRLQLLGKHGDHLATIGGDATQDIGGDDQDSVQSAGIQLFDEHGQQVQMSEVRAWIDLTNLLFSTACPTLLSIQ